MSNDSAVKSMIEFVEEKEHELQQRKLLADQQARNDAIKAILDKLEETSYEKSRINF